MTQIEEIEQIILRSIKEFNLEQGKSDLAPPDADTRLYGPESGLDSISLVSVIADIEDIIYEELNVNITLADERALSQRRSPFCNVSSLRDYIFDLLNHSKRK